MARRSGPPLAVSPKRCTPRLNFSKAISRHSKCGDPRGSAKNVRRQREREGGCSRVIATTLNERFFKGILIGTAS